MEFLLVVSIPHVPYRRIHLFEFLLFRTPLQKRGIISQVQLIHIANAHHGLFIHMHKCHNFMACPILKKENTTVYPKQIRMKNDNSNQDNMKKTCGANIYIGSISHVRNLQWWKKLTYFKSLLFK